MAIPSKLLNRTIVLQVKEKFDFYKTLKKGNESILVF